VLYKINTFCCLDTGDLSPLSPAALTILLDNQWAYGKLQNKEGAFCLIFYSIYILVRGSWVRYIDYYNISSRHITLYFIKTAYITVYFNKTEIIISLRQRFFLVNTGTMPLTERSSFSFLTAIDRAHVSSQIMFPSLRRII